MNRASTNLRIVRHGTALPDVYGHMLCRSEIEVLI